MENKPRSLLSSAFKAYSNDVAGHVMVSISFLVAATIGLAFGFISPLVLLVSIPLIFIPSFFAAQMTINCFRSGEHRLSFRQEIRYFIGYFSGTFSGCYRVGIALLKALPVIAVGLLVSSLAWYFISPSIDPSYQEAVRTFSSLYLHGDYEGAVDLLYSSAAFAKASTICCGFAGLCAWLFSAHHLSNYVGNAYVRPFFGDAPSRFSNSIYVGAFEKFKKRYYARTAGLRAIGLSLLGVGYATGIVLGIVFSWPAAVAITLAHFLSIVMFAPLLPVYFEAQEIESRRNRYYITFHLLEEAKQDFVTLFTDPSVPEETKKQAEESLRSLETKVEEEKRFLDYEGE